MTSFLYPNNIYRLLFSKPLMNGDSGNPAFVIFNGGLVLLTVWTQGGPRGGTAMTGFKEVINQFMGQLGGNYQITELDMLQFQGIK